MSSEKETKDKSNGKANMETKENGFALLYHLIYLTVASHYFSAPLQVIV
jgi:hypothetical protein